jgi:hypothetical protein
MATAARSLRSIVQNWLSPKPEAPVRVTEFKKGKLGSGCYVRVETTRGSSTVSMLFFRHRNGLWCVFPSRAEQPSMRLERC